MIIDFNEIEGITTPCIFNGSGTMTSKVSGNKFGKIIPVSVHKGGSIGNHSHDASADINYVLSGRGKAITNGVEEELKAGVCHICPRGSEHSIVNTGDDDLVMLTIVVELAKTVELEAAIDKVTRAYGMIRGLSREYHTIWLVDKDTLQMELIRSSGVSTIKNAVKMGEDYPDFDTGFEKYINTYVEPEDRARMSHDISSAEVLRQLEEKDFYAVNYLRRDESGKVAYHQIAFVNADAEDGKRQFVYGFRDIDQLVRDEERKTQQLSQQLDIINCITKAFNVIYYVNLKDYSFTELGVNLDGVEKVIHKEGNAKEAFDAMCKYLVDSEYAESMRKFTDLDTLNERLKEKTWISKQFSGPLGGWSEGIFIEANQDENGDVEHIIWATRSIDDLKRKEVALELRSNTDELTRLNNRHSYEDATDRLDEIGIPENLVYVSIDVNGLKNVNDSLGHSAGDELIIGAADCILSALGDCGTVYRIGGDEFVALLQTNHVNLSLCLDRLEKMVDGWTGRLASSLSVSYGYVERADAPSASMHDIAVLADKKMYEAKAEYYKKSGIDRRGQKEAHVALSSLYSRILKINLTEDTFQIIEGQNPDAPKAESTEQPAHLSDWLRNFADSGQVYAQDVENYLAKTDLNYMRNYFKAGNHLLNLCYRRKFEDNYHMAIMEIIPAKDYTDQDQNLYLYVKGLNI